jgi:hypothetical protein
MNTRTSPIIAVLLAAILALVFAACEGPTGPAGSAGEPGAPGAPSDPGTLGDPGEPGAPGGAGIRVYDSSATPQFLGYLLEYPGRVLTPAGNNVDIPVGSNTYIYFVGISSDPTISDTPYLSSNITAQPTTNTLYYNSWNGGTLFSYNGDSAVTVTTAWRLDASGNSAASSGVSESRYPVKWGLPLTFSTIIGGGFSGSTIVFPLQYSTSEM